MKRNRSNVKPRKVNYDSLHKQYKDPTNLQFKKLKKVSSYILGGYALLDIGIGTGELIQQERERFDVIYGIDSDEDSVEICRQMFLHDSNVNILLDDITNLTKIPSAMKFDFITALDVFEHIPLCKMSEGLSAIYAHLKEDGTFIFTGPGIFEKLLILLGRSPTHLHSHSSYGWKKIIEKSGFIVDYIAAIEFPLYDHIFLREKFHLFGKCCLIIARKMKS